MNTLIGQKAPNFTAKAIMPDNTIHENFNLYAAIEGKKCLLFFYPLDFTFVCPTEILSFHHKIAAFDERNTAVIGVSIDSHFTHLAWKNTPHSKGGIGHIRFPLVSDLNKDIARSYKVLNPEGISFRASIFIDEKLIVRHLTVNDLPIGRSVAESLRIIDAWDHVQEHGEVCPADWQKGKPAMQATSQGVADYLTSNAEEL